MPSDLASRSASKGQRPTTLPVWRFLRSQGLGVACGLGTVVLLAIGSVVISSTRDGVSANIALDDMRGFFEPPAVAHSWFYLLIGVLAVYGLNTFLATLHSVITKWRAGVRRARDYAAAVIHVGFLLALVAHLVGGLFSAERGVLMLNASWTEIDTGWRARLVELDATSYPNGRPRSVNAQVEVEAAGEREIQTLGFNDPITRGGTELLLLLQYGETLQRAVIRQGETRCELLLQETCELAGQTMALEGLFPSGHWGQVPVARMREVINGEPGPGDLMLILGLPTRAGAGEPVSLESVEPLPIVAVRWRHAAGNPLAFASALLLGLGLIMMGRRWLR